jgi:hypothetical protein
VPRGSRHRARRDQEHDAGEDHGTVQTIAER